MAKLAVFWIIFMIIPVASAICAVPAENFETRQNTTLCRGTYNIESGIKVAGDGIIVDCNNSALIGSGVGFGILLKNRSNAAVRNCSISNYEVGIYLDNTNNSVIEHNYLAKNKFGIALFNSFGNDLRDNAQIENINNEIIYIPASLTEEKKYAPEKEQAGTPNQVLEEVIKIRKPFLEQDEILNEVDFILGRYFNATKENLEITREIIYNEADKSTEIILHLKPKKILLNVSIYEKMPKCVAAYATQIFSETDYEVVKNDPLILWTFSRLDKERELSYRVFKNIDEECKGLLLAFGIATGFLESENIEKTEGKNANYLVISVVAIAALASIIILAAKRKKSP